MGPRYILDDATVVAGKAGTTPAASNRRCEGSVTDDMSNQRPDVSDEEIGMRTFQMRKARAIERAMERLRKGLSHEWAKFSNAEIEALGYILGELWAYIAHDEWDNLQFSTMETADVRRLLNLARELVNHRRNSVDILQDANGIIVGRS